MSPNDVSTGLGEAGAIARQVFGREKSAVLLLELDDLLRDVALVEGLARGIEPGLAPALGRHGRFLVRHELHGGGEIRLHEDLADPRRAALRQVDRDTRGKSPVLGLVLGDDLRHERIDREAVAGEADCRCGNLAEAHRPPARERRDPGVGCSRYNGAQHAARDLARVVLLEVVRSIAFGHVPSPGTVTTRSSAAE